MASTYSSKLRFELIATSEKSGSWGTITNTNLGTLIEQAIAGVAAVNFATDANYTLTTANGSTDEARCAVLSCTSSGSLTATRDLIVPTSTKTYLVYNNTTGAQSIRVKTTAGTGITIPTGKKQFVYCDGTNVVDSITNLPASSTIGGSAVYVVGGTDVAVADGGTGGSDAATARTNLGLVIGTNVQAYNANLTTYAAIAPSANVQTLLGAADYAAFRTSLGLVIGTNVQAYNANLTTYAGIAPSANAQTLLGHTFSQMRTDLTLVIGTDVQAYNANLTTYASVAPSANAQTLLGHTFAQMRTDLGLGTVYSIDIMTAAQYRANTASKAVTTDTAWSAATPVSVSYSATTTFDFSTFINAYITLTGNVTFANPSNVKPGQSGMIEITQDGTGSRVATWGANYFFAGGTDLVLSTVANTRDLVFYQVTQDSKIFVSLVKDAKN